MPWHQAAPREISGAPRGVSGTLTASLQLGLAQLCQHRGAEHKNASLAEMDQFLTYSRSSESPLCGQHSDPTVGTFPAGLSPETLPQVQFKSVSQLRCCCSHPSSQGRVCKCWVRIKEQTELIQAQTVPAQPLSCQISLPELRACPLSHITCILYISSFASSWI